MATILLTSSYLAAQTASGKLEGFVRDKETAQPLVGAQVSVEGTRLGNVTNEDGYYFILNVPPGHRDVTVTYTGYQKVTQQGVRFLAGHTTTLNLVLSSTVVQLDGITVEAEAEPLIIRDNTMTKQRQTSEEIASLPVNSIDEIVNMQGGVVGQRGGRFSFRGGRVGEEAVYVDGVLVKNFAAEPTMPPIMAVASFNSLYPRQSTLEPDNSPLDVNTNAVEEITIITGGFQAEYGDAKSAVINIVTKEGTEQYSGTVRYRTDGVMPRKSDFGFNEIQTNIGGPVPYLPFAYFNGSMELQGRKDWSPSDTRDEYGFHSVNQTVVNRINSIMGPDYRQASLQEFEENLSVTGLPNPVRGEGAFGDKYLFSEKITYSPIRQVKLLQTFNVSRSQLMDYNYNNTFNLDRNELVRSKVYNLLIGGDWNMAQTSRRQATINVRFAWMKDARRSGQPWQPGWENRNTIGSFGIKDIKMWPEVAVEDIEAFLRNDPWIQLNPNYNAILDTLDYMQWLDADANGQVDYWDYDTETFDSRMGSLVREAFGITPYGRAVDLPQNRGPWGVVGSHWSDPLDNRLDLTYASSGDEKYNLKFDFDTQVNRTNRAKAGVDVKYFMLNNFNAGWTNPTATILDNQPYIVSGYIQDRLDLGDFVFDMGFRMDYLDPKGTEVLSIKRGIDATLERHTRKLTEIAPRVGVAFPVTDRTQVRFSFGHFYQPPSWRFLLRGDRQGLRRATLDYSKTIMFESGFTAMLSDDIVLDVVGYNKDVQGDFAYRRVILETGQTEKVAITNMDYGNVKGFNADLRVSWGQYFNSRTSYTLQFARSTGTDPSSKESSLATRMDLTTLTLTDLPAFLDPLGYDRTHQISLQAYLMLPRDFRQGTMVGDIFKNTNLSVTAQINSGTPSDNLRYEGRQTLALVNALHNPTYKNVNLRFGKMFPLGGRRSIRIFADISNLFYNRNFRSMVDPSWLQQVNDDIAQRESRTPDYGAREIFWLPIVISDVPEVARAEGTIQRDQQMWWLSQHDLDSDGTVSSDEWRIMQLLDRVSGRGPSGSARWIRLGAEFNF
ncbi:MAG: carboxypeptidase regulatory-like domain-containing protein [Candidatus Glassbacteria bacterium]|nr:carboxypeptidase regulatory-like domain-containing protein [Candidatus Glassbacteria bacterium]